MSWGAMERQGRESDGQRGSALLVVVLLMAEVAVLRRYKATHSPICRIVVGIAGISPLFVDCQRTIDRFGHYSTS